MKKLSVLLFGLVLFACADDDVKQKTTLDSEQWYFENMFPLGAVFTITPTLEISNPTVFYYSIPEAQKHPQINSIQEATTTGFTKLTLAGQGYTVELFSGQVRASNPYFIDVDRLEFTAPGGAKTTLDNIVMKRLK